MSARAASLATAAIAIFAIVAAVAPASAARAQACCTATSGGEIGTVGPCYRATLTAQVAWDHAFGSWDGEGEYRPLRAMSADDVTTMLAGGVRFASQSLFVRGAAPMRLQHRAFEAGESSTRVGLGDVSGALGATILEDPQGGIDWSDPSTLVPFVELALGVRAPTGRAPAQTQDVTGADVMGDGAWELSLEAKTTKFVTGRNSITLAAQYGHRFEHDAGDRRFQPGEAISLRASWLHLPSLFWSFGAFGTLAVTTDVSVDGETVPGSGTRRLRAGAFVSHALSFPEWELTATLASDALFDGGGEDLPLAGTTLALAVQRAFF